MNKQDILQADLLDILFEHRNKSYGAYRLRRDYNHRLFIALGIALTAVILIYFISWLDRDRNPAGLTGQPDNTVTIRDLIIIPPKPDLPAPIRQVKPVARVKDVSIRVVPDILADQAIPDQSLLAKNSISTTTVDGTPATDPAIAIANTVTTGTGDKSKSTDDQDKFVPAEMPPSFPGGPMALAAFFSKTLRAPEELEAGERKVVYVQFIVGADGSITKTEIVQSGGNLYDQEVLRCFKRMPRWNPASQNGMKIAVSFTQPVTFVGMDQ